MHFQTFTGNSSGPTILPFCFLLSAFFTSFLLTQFTSSLITSVNPSFLQNPQQLILAYFLFQHRTFPLFPYPLFFLHPHVHSIFSAPRTILSCFDAFSINPSRFSQKSFFSSMLLLTCEVYALTIFRMDPFTSSFMTISLSDTLYLQDIFSQVLPHHYLYPIFSSVSSVAK